MEHEELIANITFCVIVIVVCVTIAYLLKNLLTATSESKPFLQWDIKYHDPKEIDYLRLDDFVHFTVDKDKNLYWKGERMLTIEDVSMTKINKPDATKQVNAHSISHLTMDEDDGLYWKGRRILFQEDACVAPKEKG